MSETITPPVFGPRPSGIPRRPGRRGHLRNDDQPDRLLPGLRHATARPIIALTAEDFYGHAGSLADEAAFRAAVDERHRHRVERDRLGRTSAPPGASTPWGLAQATTIYGPGIRRHSTASHGGFELDPDRNALVHEALRAGPFYEEDCDWAAVALSFPELFTTYERHQAERTVCQLMPEAWGAIHGRPLQPGESEERDRRLRGQP